MQKHVAFYISNKDNKQDFINRVVLGDIITEFSSLKGQVFSEKTLNAYIKEEILHGTNIVTAKTKNSLLNSSEGERKQALLTHLIALNPEYLLVDNIYGNLDATSQNEIENTLSRLSKTTPIIQITNRKEELLPFISEVYKFENNIPVLYVSNNSLPESSGSEYFVSSLPVLYKENEEVYKSIVKFKNVTIQYRERTIVNHINWEIKPGEFWYLKGPNGSGKSTLLSLISGDNPKAYNQDITLFGIKKGSGESVWDIKRKIGYFSSEHLRGFERLQAIEKMVISGFFDSIGLYKIPNEQQIVIAHQWLKILDMFHIKDKSFLSLSEGHQRLVLIARAMVKHPPLLILDEPTNGLDDDDAELFCKLVNKIALESNTAILYVSHREEEKLLKPDYVFMLCPHETGSVGSVITI